MTLKREIKDAYLEGGNSIYVKTHSNAVYVDENETETLTKRLDNVKDSITKHTSQLDNIENNIDNYKEYVVDDDWQPAIQRALSEKGRVTLNDREYIIKNEIGYCFDRQSI